MPEVDAHDRESSHDHCSSQTDRLHSALTQTKHNIKRSGQILRSRTSSVLTFLSNGEFLINVKDQTEWNPAVTHDLKEDDLHTTVNLKYTQQPHRLNLQYRYNI